MIRRTIGNEYFLFTQAEHARFSGELVRHLPGVSESTGYLESLFVACAGHDAGWTIHDDAPRITPKHQPVDVFELPPFLGFKLWAESAKRIAMRDAYAGLLVSLHSLGISIFAAVHMPKSHPEIASDPQWKFELNKFQHAQIELQEKLRKQLGLRTDLPLEAGLAKDSDDPAEQELFYNFRIVQAADQLSLCMCCQKPPFDTVGLLPAPGQPCIEHHVARHDEFVLNVDPWPFDQDAISVPMQYRRVPMIIYTDDDHLRREYASAKVETIETKVIAKG